MTTITERNAAALIERNGTTLPEAAPRKRTRKAAPAPATAPETPETEAPAAPSLCRCGCGEETKPGRLYRPGHDARHAGDVARRVVAGAPEAEAELAALPPKLAEKARRFVSNRAAESARKEKAAAIRAAAKAALQAELAAI